MPAKRLSEVMPEARVRDSPCQFRSELHQLATDAFSTCATIEAQLATLLVVTLGASAAPAAAMLKTLNGAKEQRDAIAAAGKAILSPERGKMLDKIIKRIEAAYVPRNRLAHCLWSCSPDVPGAILLVDKQAVMQMNLQAMELMLNRWAGGDIVYDPAHIWVYTQEDLEQVCEDLRAALWLVIDFRQLTSFERAWEGREDPFTTGLDKKLRRALDY